MKLNRNSRYELEPQMKLYDFLDFKFLPHIMFTQSPNFKSEIVNTDSKGFRFNSNVKKKNIFEVNKKKSTILLLGGSTAFGVGATKDERTIAGILDRKTKYNCLNLAGRGYSGFQELLGLFSNINLLKELKIKKIIMLSGINDLYLNTIKENRYPGNFFFISKFKQDINNSFFSLKKKFILKILKIYLNVIGDKAKYDFKNFSSKDVIKFLISRKYRKIFLLKEYEKIKLNDVLERNFEIYKILEKVFNCEVLFFFQPILKICKELSNKEKELIKISEKYFSEENRKVNHFLSDENYYSYVKLFKKISNSKKIKFFDTNAYIKKKNFGKISLFVDNVHLSDDGNKVVASYIEKII